ncbi:MAG: YicC family protein, partial [Clostridia bacterium]|nr:YicC family protein [Clostridia bacterium]
MIKSMTGFGRSEYCDGKRNIIVEIKSVNHRYNDISIRMPKKYSFTEEKIKAAIKNVVKRGKVDVSIIIENLSDSDSSVELNTDLARQYYNSLNVLKNEFQLDQEISVSLL